MALAYDALFGAIATTRDHLAQAFLQAKGKRKEKEEETAAWNAAVAELNALDERHLRMQHALYTVDVSKGDYDGGYDVSFRGWEGGLFPSLSFFLSFPHFTSSSS